MSNRFAGQTMVITGASSGIGLAAARLAAAEGAQIALIARRREKLEEALASLPGEGHRIYPCDVSKWEEVQATASQILNDFGTPQWVINSAGITRPGYFWELPIEVFYQIMEIDYYGIVHMCKAFVPSMMEARNGHIINISSVAGFIGVFGYTAYSPAKFAVWGFTDSLRVELKHFGVQMHIVFPPDTDTPQLHGEMPYKPPETKVLSETAGLLTAEQVARTMLDAAARGKYVILPGTETKLLWKLSNIAGAWRYFVVDYLLADARRKLRKRGIKPAGE